MSLRLSVSDALEKGLIDKKTAKAIRSQPSVTDRLNSQAKTSTKGAPGGSPPHSDVNDINSPQRMIFEGLERRQKGIAIWEMEGLVPGRRFRADIYLPESRLVVEMDGYGPHMRLDAFKADRDRRNMMVALGYPVIAFYYSRVKNELEGVIDEIIRCHNIYKGVNEHLFFASLEEQIKSESESQCFVGDMYLPPARPE